MILYSLIDRISAHSPDVTVGAPTESSGLNNMPFVYILKSKRDNRYYIGSTIDLTQRLKHHASGGTPTTKKFGKLELVFVQEYSSLNDARNIERKLKKFKRRDFLEKIIEDKIIKIRP